MNKNNKKKAGDNFEKPIINTKCTKLTKKIKISQYVEEISVNYKIWKDVKH